MEGEIWFGFFSPTARPRVGQQNHDSKPKTSTKTWLFHWELHHQVISNHIKHASLWSLKWAPCVGGRLLG